MSHSRPSRHQVRPSVAIALVVLASAFVCLAPIAAQPAPVPGASPVTDAERRAVVDSIATLLAKRYVFAEVGKRAGDHVRARLAAGAYDTLDVPVELAQRLTTDLQSISRDKHMRVVVRPVLPTDAEDALSAVVRSTRPSAVAADGIQRVERLDGNIGYLELRGFAPVEAARDQAVAAMRLLAGSDAVIIDLRRNGGGSPEMVQLIASYFFDKPTHLNSLHWREGERVQEFWTLANVPGEKLVDVPLFVLTSKYTFSGAEEFSYNMQTRKRATLIGETTGGGANPGGVFPASERFGLFVPTGRAVNPVTKTNWEGIGVTPEVSTPAEAALDTALSLAAKAATGYRAAANARTLEARQALSRELARTESLVDGNRTDEATAVLRAALRAAIDAKLMDEASVNALGYRYLQGRAVAMAIAVFTINAEFFPASANTYDSLGEALMVAGRNDQAVTNYRRSLELDERNDNARTMLKKLGVTVGTR